MRASLEKIAAAWALAGGAVLLLIAAVTAVNAGAFLLDRVARLSGGSVAGLPGYEDFVRLAVSAAALMLFPYCQARRGHVAVDLLFQRFPNSIQSFLRAAWNGLIAALVLFLAYWMTLGMAETRADHELSRVLGWPEWPFYAPGIASLILWALIAAAQALDRASDG